MMQPAKNKRSPEFIREVNRLYHEGEAGVYDTYHPEIFTDEEKTWQRLGKFLPKVASGTRVLDIGSGTGFVPGILGRLLAEKDTITLTDISPAMLAEARRKFAGQAGPAFVFVETSAEQLPFA